MPHHLSPLDRARFERDVEHAVSLGPRSVAEAFFRVADLIGGFPAMASVLAEYRRLTPAMVRAAGGDKPVPRLLHVVPPA